MKYNKWDFFYICITIYYLKAQELLRASFYFIYLFCFLINNAHFYIALGSPRQLNINWAEGREEEGQFPRGVRKEAISYVDLRPFG